MKARIEALLRRLGPAGIAGVGVLLAPAWGSTPLAPLEAGSGAAPGAERLKARGAPRDHLPAGAPTTAPLLQPVPAHGPAHRRSRTTRSPGALLDLAQGEYRLSGAPRALGLPRHAARAAADQFRDSSARC
jgi:hypothetical protein